MTKGISVCIPAYKEAENLEKLLPKLKDTLSQISVPSEILVIDTMEPMDNTNEVCGKNHANYVPRVGGNFYGDAIRTAISKSQYEFMVIMDGDGSHNPEDINRMFVEMEQSRPDLIIGSRYMKGGNSDNNFILKLMSYALNLAYRIVFGIKAKDVSDSFRMYHLEQVKALELECNNFDIVEELLIKLQYSKKGFAIKEIPVFFDKREFGESKRDLKKFILSYFVTMKRLYGLKRKCLKKRSVAMEEKNGTNR